MEEVIYKESFTLFAQKAGVRWNDDGNWEGEKKIREQNKHWIVNKEKMSLNNAYFMHCLPVRRNVEVTDEVIDSKNSIVIDEVENRMWAQWLYLSSLITNNAWITNLIFIKTLSDIVQISSFENEKRIGSVFVSFLFKAYMACWKARWYCDY